MGLNPMHSPHHRRLPTVFPIKGLVRAHLGREALDQAGGVAVVHSQGAEELDVEERSHAVAEDYVLFG